MRIDVVSIFPEYLSALDLSLIGKARQQGLLELTVTDLREFTTDRHRTVDDTPYGGGAGMVMKPEPWAAALGAVLGGGPAPAGERPVLVVPSPAGEVFTQATARELALREHLVFACGRYEGIDERVVDWSREHFEVRPMSLGDYVLNGGEVAVLAMVEAVGRLVPGVVGNPESLVEESHADGLLEYPVYTKPALWRDRPVPEVLLSGHHGRIARWRRDRQLQRTAARRPDLVASLDPAGLDRADRAVLAEAGWVVSGGHVVRAGDGASGEPVA
ncbi:tRNA (guanosine(37)-N1)-methyltransferase TrmD [Kocuria rosea]|jgi:tRNA (guanine37-N1)-methyltransferase|uniref:tRNA (guanine-N(1)-)-methyltransferase n=1 Tax=Kocuria rosea subsp. polaris TaxID=136273 RepID=A0A0A6VRL4_KOCRO|nr:MULTISPECIES: tRNA (guanosine(37)-N1)-methyltransferase TrmD [Kocuria]KHD96419.1 tRNA (guanine-N1)-methyltransferase [Kocuria polaris]MEB2528850.1 tRNA (guanosine(37)-N1)-methyltransferase TrmD [Kocuria rosea]MEB2619194.1 tRNA (guanosine(37)-N1)-methyltransferase TrmD [Kocuria rosea]NVC23287.1 tRNA (guanosine(37)-N1)-methyltransferase TrmD [Kocuria salina]PWF87874.1 tRNA (guanosine(37)-N1)-methyltransferase TrmD [Kocuria rosea]